MLRRTRLGLAGVVVASVALLGSSILPAAAADRTVADATVRDAQPIAFPSAATSAATSGGTTIDCPADGECVAGGQVASSTDPGSEVPFIVVQHDGIWGTAQVLEFPTGAITAGATTRSSVFGIECPAIGECEVVGVVSIDDASTLAWRSRVTSSTASMPQMLGFVPAAPFVVEDSYPNDIACVAIDECLIVGDVTLHDDQPGLIYTAVQWTINGGVQSVGAVIPLPSSVHDPSNADALTSASSVSCPSAGECVVTGSSDRTQSDPVTWVRIQHRGVWGDASVVAPPANLVVIDPSRAMFARSVVECWSIGECMVLGNFQSAARSRGLAPFTALIVGGVAQAGAALVLPAAFAGNEDVYGAGLVCSGPGACLADARLERPSLGMAAIVHYESIAGVWGNPVTLPTIAGATDAFVGQSSCRSPGNCVLGVVTANGSYAVIESSGTWNAPISLNPVGSARTAPYADVFDIACVRGGLTCVLTGQAIDELVDVSAMPAAVDARSMVPSSLRGARSPEAVGSSPQTTTAPWAFVQSIDWSPPPPAPEPVTPKYTG